MCRPRARAWCSSGLTRPCVCYPGMACNEELPMIDSMVVRHRRAVTATLIAVVALLATPEARAVPSFARQTGMACEACHTVFPELTHFGRMFKANGYNVDNLKPVRGITATKQEMLALSGLPPIS